ncbi:FtsH protease activity modulator HflK [Leeia sp. TBRC 13508]|uniref:Protein HflK n=1 Tax=Leeia speluncae TaxID=2884804 RepID=A0ABS8DAP1_9NEIS|nr:FtsH protease activity modulator HflK [Leeia speluncae]MCB6185280.1 FtsH protease activity modulator HflK [Leeia speluncae]
MSDSQWGKGNKNGGPPDLDDIFRQLNEKIYSLFGKKAPSNGGPTSQPSGIGGVVGIALIVLLLIWAATGFYIVDAKERGVVLRFGKFSEVTSEGLNWHLPYPFEDVYVINLTQVRSVEIGYRDNSKNKIPEEALMVTEDQNIVDVQLAIQYDITDPKAYLFNNVFTMADAQDVVKQAGEAAIREVVGRNKIDAVLNEGRGKIAVDVKTTIQSILDKYGSGVRVTQVSINQVQPPEAVQASFDDATRAVQDKDKSKSEGEAYFNDKVPKAKGLASRLEAESEGYRQSVIANAEGEASRFSQVLEAYSEAPAVTRQRMYLDTMQKVLTSSSKVLVDQKNGNNLLYLPLDKLLQQENLGVAKSPSVSGSTSNVPSSSMTVTKDTPDSAVREGR